ncbi:hypothetical protein [uncultured Alistipes sp.]|uniref:hypothetical protein n=1 Tax=uncultured Alistipes sp. TaxID=538949 RepID=UPI00261B104A|nr:hypothetical protein [uncultured Alistipes sp.]
METKRLDFATTLQDAIAIGLKNAPSVIAAVALWLVTIWVPYINVGTTIAITLLPTRLAKGEIVNPLGIFDSKYRRYMGEYFITMGLMVFPILIGVLFMIVPAIVLSIAWTLSYYFLFEKGKNPIQAIKASNDATYGSKWTMFAVQLVVGIIVGIVLGIFRFLCDTIDVGFITFIVMFVLYVLAISISMAVNASYWKQLKDNVE